MIVFCHAIILAENVDIVYLYVDNVYMRLVQKLWKQSSDLTATALLMLAALVASLATMALDPRTIGGVSAWLKPAKFAISTAIFCATMAWIFGYLQPSRRLKLVGRILSAALTLEVLIIFVQAARGTTSHFNFSTPLSGALFGIMGVGILTLWVATIAVFIAAMRHKFQDGPWGWALRLGLLITVIGSAAGGLMLRTTPAQAGYHQTPIRGAHTVGAPDGGPGLPVVDWSTEHGDLRIPHFLGLHALQAIPLFAWLVRKRRRQTTLIGIAAASYFSFVAVLAWQALRGESVAHPGSETLAALAVWFAVSAGAFAWSQLPYPAPRLHHSELSL